MKNAGSNAPIIIPLTILAFVLLMALMLIARPIYDAVVLADKVSDWLGLAGSVVGGILTIVAAYIAWIGIGRQIRIGVIAREEDRIDKSLPGLRAAELKAQLLLAQVDVLPLLLGRKTRGFARAFNTETQAAEALERLGLSDDIGRMTVRLEEELPFTDDAVRRELAVHLTFLKRSLDIVGQTQSERKKAENENDHKAMITEVWTNPHFTTVEDTPHFTTLEDNTPLLVTPDMLERAFLYLKLTLDREEQAMTTLTNAISQLDNYRADLVKRTSTYEARRIRLRIELEDYFSR
jgi:hypothetical protein